MRMKLFALPLILLVLSLPVRADRLFTAGLEEDDTTNTMWSGITNSPAIVTTQKHSGTFSLQVTPSGADEDVFRDLASGLTTGTLCHRFYVRWAAFPTTAAFRFFFAIENVGGGAAAQLAVEDSGPDFRLRLRAHIPGTSDDSVINLALDTWYRMELRHLISDTVGELELNWYIGDSTTAEETLSLTGIDTLPTTVQRFFYGHNDDANVDIFYDDVAINDTNGSFENSCPGPGKVFLLEPSGDNSVNWTQDGSSAEATNWEGVDDLPGAPDDGVTYNSATTNLTDKLDMTNLGAEVPSDADIILVDVYGRQGSDGTAGARVIDFELWDEADSQSTLLDVFADLNGWAICNTAEHLVFDAGSRTKANIDSFRVGYSRSIGGSNEIRITAQWVNVEWIEAVAAPPFRPKVVVY